MKYENVKFNVGNEEFDVVHCLGDGLCECDSCKQNGKYSVSWTSLFHQFDENDKEVLCRGCLSEILIQRRIDKVIKDKIEQGTLIEQKTCENVSEMHPTDGFTCSECGITIVDYVEERVDDEYHATYHEYEIKYCPNCGAKVVEG